MLSFRKAAPLFLVAAISGCATPPSAAPVAPSHPISSEELIKIRDQYRREIPDSRVGLVKAVKLDAALCAVGDVNPADFHEGDLLEIVDSNQHVVSDGTLDSIDGALLIVHFKVLPGGRAPSEGDLAVRAVK